MGSVTCRGGGFRWGGDVQYSAGIVSEFWDTGVELVGGGDHGYVGLGLG